MCSIYSCGESQTRFSEEVVSMFNFGVQETKERIDVTVDTAKKTADEAQSIMQEMKTTHVIEKAQNAAEAASNVAKEAQTIFTKIERGHVVDNANSNAVFSCKSRQNDEKLPRI